MTEHLWTISKSPSHNGFRVSNPAPDVVGIDISVFAPYGASEKEWQARALALAHKVASAPELLELVKLFAASIRFEIKRDERSGEDEGAKLKGLTLARVEAAIAAAEGREG